MKQKVKYFIQNFLIMLIIISLTYLILNLFWQESLIKIFIDSFALSVFLASIMYFRQMRKLRKLGLNIEEVESFKSNQMTTVKSDLNIIQIKKLLLNNFEIEKLSLDDSISEISLLTKKNFSLDESSWGEIIKISLVSDQSNEKNKYAISSKSRFWFTFMDMGNNIVNIFKLKSLIS